MTDGMRLGVLVELSEVNREHCSQKKLTREFILLENDALTGPKNRVVSDPLWLAQARWKEIQ
jgi:hypothetical protein